MQKFRWTWITLLLLLIVAVTWTVYNMATTPTSQSRPPLISFIASGLGVKTLVIDMNANANPSIYDSFNGEDSIVVFHSNPDPNIHTDDKLQSQYLLSLIDQNHDGKLDPNDPLFSRLELLTYDAKTGKATFMPIYNAGIRVVYLDLTNAQGQPISTTFHLLPHPVGTVILSDGSARLIRDMLVDQSYLTPAFSQQGSGSP